MWNTLITLKKNQGQLYKNVEQLFKEAICTGFEGIKYSTCCTKEQKHGREEIRHYLMITDIDERVDPNHKWQKLKSVGLVESVRTVNGKTTVETRYYISSLTNNAELFGQSVRSHWPLRLAPAFQKAGARRSGLRTHYIGYLM